jgi:myo-inositol 2-dehydrogenase/D-chiro-inositol 1-dehydrogenase
MIRIGWIGCGTHAGEMLLPQLVRLPVRLAALADIDATRLNAIGDRYGVAARSTDGRALIEAGGIDAVGMAVGPRQHAGLAAIALRRGLPVYIEKPPAATAAAAQALADLAAEAGKPCVVGFMKRYSTANRIAGNLLPGAEFGRRASLLGEYMTAPPTSPAMSTTPASSSITACTRWTWCRG